MAEVLHTDTTTLMAIPDPVAALTTPGSFVRRSDRIRKALERFITASSVATVREPEGLVTKTVPTKASISIKNVTAKGSPTLKRKAAARKTTKLAKRRQMSKGSFEMGRITHDGDLPMEGVDSNREIITHETSAQSVLKTSDPWATEELETGATCIGGEPSEVPDDGLVGMPTAEISKMLDIRSTDLPDIKTIELPNAEATDIDVLEVDDMRDEDFVPASSNGATGDFDSVITPPLQGRVLVDTSVNTALTVVNTLPAKKRSPRKKSTSLPKAEPETEPVPPVPAEPRPEPFGFPLVWAEVCNLEVFLMIIRS